MNKERDDETLDTCLEDTFLELERARSGHSAELKPQEVGIVNYVGQGIARVSGMASVKSEELVRFPDSLYGLVFNIDPDEVGIIMLDPSEASPRARRWYGREGFWMYRWATPSCPGLWMRSGVPWTSGETFTQRSGCP